MGSRRSRPRSANVSRSSLRIIARYVVEEIGVGELRGVLVRPEQIDRPPVALIVAGSGPTDRDGNNPAFRRDDMLRDKRGIGASRVEGLREEDVTLEHFVN